MSAISLAPQLEETRRERISSTLDTIVKDLIGIDTAQLESGTTFLEMGVDSLSLLQASQAIQDKFGVTIPFRLLMEELDTVEALAAHLDAELPPEETRPKAAEPFPPPPELAAPRPLSVQPAPAPRAPSSAAPQPAVDESVAPADLQGVERILQQQIQLMAQQLELLRNDYAGAASAAAPHASEASPAISAAPAPDFSHTLPAYAPASPTPSNGQPKVGHRQTPPVESPEEGVVSPGGDGAAPVRPGTDSVTNEVIHPVIDPEPFVAYKAIEKKKARGGLTPPQQQHLEDLIERVTRRTAGSKRVTQRYRFPLADSSATAGFRFLWKEMCYPLVVERADGSRVWDVDGNEYVDVTMGFGSLLFGHSPPFVVGALQEQLGRGLQNSWKTEVAGKVAELLCELTGTERVALCNSGTEAVMSALRLARVVTGRTRIAVFAGSFHGTFDGVLVRGEKNPDGTLRAVPMAPGIPQHMIENVLVLAHSDPQSLVTLKEHMHELAAVLVEPSPSRRPDVQSKEFLQELRRITTEGGAALIFDEVIIGFRMHPGGGQALFDVRADIVCYGKALGSGTPIGAVAGKARYLDAIDGGMWNFGDASFPRVGTTYYAGTFFKHPLVMSAVLAVLTHLKEQGPQLQERLGARTTRFVAEVNAYFDERGMPMQVMNFGSLFRFYFSTEWKHSELFFYELLARGVWVSETRVCFFSTAFTEEDFRHVSRAIRESADALREGGFMPPPDPPAPDDEKGATLQSAVAGETHAARDDGAGAASGVRRVPTTEAQKGLWVLSQLSDETSSAYNEAINLRMTGTLNVGALGRAIQQVVNRHEALRTSFSADGEEQQIAAALALEIPLVDFSEAAADERQGRVSEWLGREVARPFDMSNGPLMRVRLARLGGQEHLLAIIIHHIVTDGWSFDHVLGEIKALYSAECLNAPCELPEPMQFSEYARAQARRQEDGEAAYDEAYWLTQFAAAPPLLNLPTDRARPALQTFNGARLRRVIGAPLPRELKAAGAKRGCTLYVTLLSGFQLLLHQLTGQSDVVAGSHSAGQTTVGGPSLVGFCINMLPMRSQIDGGLTFPEYLKLVRKTAFDALEHQSYPISRLIKKLKLVRDPGRPPLVSVVFNMDRMIGLDNGAAGEGLAGLEIEQVESPSVRARFDFLWNMVDAGDELILDCTYNTDLFDAATVEGWMESYETLLRTVAARPEIRLDALLGALGEAAALSHVSELRELEDARQEKFKTLRRRSQSAS